MPLTSLDHYLLQVADLEASKNWYVRVLGMEEGPMPDFRVPACWLYVNGAPVLHMTVGGKDVSEVRLKYLGQESQATSGSGVIDHVAFKATGLAETIAHLEAEGAEFTKRQVDAEGAFQLFVKGPDGVKIELNFDVAEAKSAGIEPTLMASDL
ncbi:MAG: VOC family protein [Rhodospirillales bacterium]|nr:VOC family protein [Rhodospirillales bacterium]